MLIAYIKYSVKNNRNVKSIKIYFFIFKTHAEKSINNSIRLKCLGIVRIKSD